MCAKSHINFAIVAVLHNHYKGLVVMAPYTSVLACHQNQSVLAPCSVNQTMSHDMWQSDLQWWVA
jgi:hypothetical protein